MTTTTASGAGRAARRSRRSSRTSSRQEAAHRAEAPRGSWRSGWSASSPSRARDTKALGLQDTTDLHRSSTRPATGSSSRARTTGSSAASSGDRRLPQLGRREAARADQRRGLPAPGPRDRLARRRRHRRLGDLRVRRAALDDPGHAAHAALRRLRPVGRRHGHPDHHRDLRGFCMLIGIPIGIWMARRKAVSAVVTPVLDVMQTLPPFCYLAPMALFFGIGSAAAIVLTLIYALPPLVRITEHGIRTVSPTTVEAARSMGLTRGQMLRQVQLPMARRTIVVGINQCMMAALSMATIAALVNGPASASRSWRRCRSRTSAPHPWPAWPSCAMAIMLDRTTTAASERVAGRTDVGVGQRPGRDADRRHARAAAAVGDRGRRQGSAPAPADPGRPLAAPGAAARAGGLLRLALALPARLREVPGRQRDPGPQVHQRSSS